MRIWALVRGAWGATRVTKLTWQILRAGQACTFPIEENHIINNFTKAHKQHYMVVVCVCVYTGLLYGLVGQRLVFMQHLSEDMQCDIAIQTAQPVNVQRYTYYPAPPCTWLPWLFFAPARQSHHRLWAKQGHMRKKQANRSGRQWRAFFQSS